VGARRLRAWRVSRSSFDGRGSWRWTNGQLGARRESEVERQQTRIIWGENNMRRFWIPIVLASFLLIPLLGCGKDEGDKGEPGAQPGGGIPQNSLEEKKKQDREKVKDLINKARKNRR